MLRCSSVAAVVLLLLGLHLPAQGQVVLKPKATPDVKRTHEVTQLITQTLTINGTDFKTEVDSGFTLSSTAGKKDADGKIPHKVKFESMRINLTIPGDMGLSFDSSINLAKSDSPALEPVLDSLKTLSGASYTLVVDADNQFVAVEGVEEIINAAPGKAMDMLKLQLSAEKLKQEHQQALDRYPSKAVTVGETWERVEPLDLGSGQVMKVQRQYEYAGVEQRGGRTLDKLNVTDKKVVSFDIEPNNQVPFKVSKSDLSIGESKGGILFDRELGAEIESTRVIQIKGQLTLSIGGMDLPTDLDLRIEGANRLKE